MHPSKLLLLDGDMVQLEHVCNSRSVGDTVQTVSDLEETRRLNQIGHEAHSRDDLSEIVMPTCGVRQVSGLSI